MQADPDKINAVIMGIGINANQKQEHFDEEIQHIATSLAIESGKPIVRAELMQQIYLQLEKLYEEYLQNGFSVIKILLGKLRCEHRERNYRSNDERDNYGVSKRNHRGWCITSGGS